MRITLLIASLILVGCQKAPKTAAVAPIYDSAAVETRKIEVTVDASGVVEPESTVEVKSKASGEVLMVHGETGDVVQANNERWHRATCAPNTGSCTRLAMTPRNREGQVHYFQVDQPAGN